MKAWTAADVRKLQKERDDAIAETLRLERELSVSRDLLGNAPNIVSMLRAEIEQLRQELAAMREASQTLYDASHVDYEHDDVVYWTRREYVDAFVTALSLSDD